MGRENYNRIAKMISRTKESRLRNEGSDILVEDIKNYILALERENEMLKEFNRSDKIEKLNKELRETRRDAITILSDLEKLRVAEFRGHHECVDMRLEYIITPTGMGEGVKVRCKKCGYLEDVTDYESW